MTLNDTREATNDLVDRQLIEAYFRYSAKAKNRRLAALIVMAVLLVGVLLLILAKGWTDFAGGTAASVAWIWAGVIVSVLAIAGVVVDIIFRRQV